MHKIVDSALQLMHLIAEESDDTFMVIELNFHMDEATTLGETIKNFRVDIVQDFLETAPFNEIPIVFYNFVQTNVITPQSQTTRTRDTRRFFTLCEVLASMTTDEYENVWKEMIELRALQGPKDILAIIHIPYIA